MLKWILGLLVLAVLAAVAAYVWAGRGLKPLTHQAQESAPGQFAELSAGRVHYQFSGPEDGKLIMLVHGYSTPSFIFTQNVEALNAAGFRTLQFDHFGRGFSDRPRARYDVEFYDAELIELLDALDVDQPVGLVGLSMGGPIVTEFAARHPERVTSVFLFVPAGFEVAGPKGLTRALIEMPVIGDFIWRMNWKKLLSADPQYNENDLAPENRLQGDVFAQMAYKGYAEALHATLKHFPMSDREDTYQRFAATGLPVKAVFGDADPTVLIASADGLKAAVPAAEIRVLEGADHGLNYKRHGDVNGDLVAWLEQH